MKDTPAIEKADSADAEAILALQKLAYKDEAKIYGDFQIPPLLETLRRSQKQVRDSPDPQSLGKRQTGRVSKSPFRGRHLPHRQAGCSPRLPKPRHRNPTASGNRAVLPAMPQVRVVHRRKKPQKHPSLREIGLQAVQG